MPVLSSATKLYVGNSPVSAVYAGANKVWPAGGFLPSSLNGLAVWHDGSQLALSDGVDVTAWPNLGSANQVTFIGTPKFRAGAVNGKGVVHFNTTCAMRGNNPQYASVGDGHGLRYRYTIFYVSQWVGPTPGRCLTAPYPEGGNCLFGYHSSGIDCFHDDGGWLASPLGYGTPPAALRLYGADNEPGIGLSVYNNGVLKGGPGTAGRLEYRYNINGYAIDALTEAGDFYVCELIIYDRRLVSAERIQVEEYLRGKWGVAPPALVATLLPVIPLPPPLVMPT